MKKTLIIMGLATILMAGCQTEATKPAMKKEVKIELSDAELQSATTEENVRVLLLKKSILKEMDEVQYTKEEKEELDQLKKDVEIEYFLNKKAGELVTVTDNDILAIYQNNIEQLKDMDINEVLTQIKAEVMSREIQTKKIEYISSLIDKYELDKKVAEYTKKEEAPKEEAVVNKEVETPAPATSTQAN